MTFSDALYLVSSGYTLHDLHEHEYRVGHPRSRLCTCAVHPLSISSGRLAGIDAEAAAN